MSITPTRGERNNNPGNIDRNVTKWQGMAEDQSSDPRFIIFLAPKWGIRAIARILKQYQRIGKDTIKEIIDTWAPPAENDTSAYIKAVCNDCHITPDDIVDISKPLILTSLVKAIIIHENGRCIYTDDQILEGVSLA